MTTQTKTIDLFNQCQNHITALLHGPSPEDPGRVETELRAALAELARRAEGADAWRELAQSRGRRAIAERQEDIVAISLASGQATAALRTLRELGVPEEQLQ